MTTLYTGYSSNHRCQAAEYRRQLYIGNGWGSVRRWNGQETSLSLAGIEGPSRDLDSWTPSPTEASGDCNPGIHVFRYRYLDSKTGFVSDPSEEREIEISTGGKQLTFNVNTSGAANIIRSTDSKVDTIVIEMTTRGSTVFFEAARELNTASTIVVNLTDATLGGKLLAWPDYGHLPPPVGKNIISFRERLFVFGQVVHSIGNADFTNLSVDVAEGSTDPDWNTEALGSASGESDVEWLIQKDGDSRSYAIDYYDSGNSKIVLKEAYQGGTTTDSSYKIYSRANVVWVSRPGYPEAFEPLDFINGPNGELSGDLTAGIGFFTSVLLFSLSGMYQLIWEDNPVDDGTLVAISTQRGALSQRVVINVEGKVYGMDHTGWWLWSGGLPQHISGPVDEIKDLIDFAQAENFHCVWIPKARAIRWFVCYSGETYPKKYVQLDVDTGHWGTGEYKQGISESRLVPTAEGPKAYLGDENGYIWEADTGNSDGCPDGLSHVTVNSASTTLIAINEVFSASDLVNGCYAYSPDLNEYALIEDSTGATLTLASPGFSSALTLNQEVWIGPIPALLKTRAYMAPMMGPKHRLRARYIYLGVQPSSSYGEILVRTYEDYSSTARGIDKSDSRNNLPGITWPESGDDDVFKVDGTYTGGVVRIPVGAEFMRSLEAELEFIEPGAPYEIFYLSLGSTEREGLA